MPECKLGLNDRVLLEAQGRSARGKSIDLDDIKFHQYVIFSNFYFYPFFCVMTLSNPKLVIEVVWNFNDMEI